MSDQEWNQVNGGDKSWESVLLKLIVLGTIYTTAALLGFWRGGKQRLFAYASYLLRQLPREARTTLVELAFEEAKALRERAG